MIIMESIVQQLYTVLADKSEQIAQVIAAFAGQANDEFFAALITHPGYAQLLDRVIQDHEPILWPGVVAGTMAFQAGQIALAKFLAHVVDHDDACEDLEPSEALIACWILNGIVVEEECSGSPFDEQYRKIFAGCSREERVAFAAANPARYARMRALEVDEVYLCFDHVKKPEKQSMGQMNEALRKRVERSCQLYEGFHSELISDALENHKYIAFWIAALCPED
jgi:hypothetical protein